jgi:hypothetical protein
MRFKLNPIILVFFFSFSSCSIKGDFKGLYSYYSKTKSKNPTLFYKPNKSDTICNITNASVKSRIVIINGLDLKKCIDVSSNSIIYFWSPKCKSKVCFPLDIVQSVCNSQNIDLYVVAEYYDLEQMEINHEITRPIFGIDTEYYKTNLTKKYITKFLEDIKLDSNTYNRYFYFKKGVFIESYESIYNIKVN